MKVKHWLFLAFALIGVLFVLHYIMSQKTGGFLSTLGIGNSGGGGQRMGA